MFSPFYAYLPISGDLGNLARLWLRFRHKYNYIYKYFFAQEIYFILVGLC